MAGTIDSGSLIGKAINYSLNQQDYLERYLVNGSISIDNSAALSSALENPQDLVKAA